MSAKSGARPASHDAILVVAHRLHEVRCTQDHVSDCGWYRDLGDKSHAHYSYLARRLIMEFNYSNVLQMIAKLEEANRIKEEIRRIETCEII